MRCRRLTILCALICATGVSACGTTTVVVTRTDVSDHAATGAGGSGGQGTTGTTSASTGATGSSGATGTGTTGTGTTGTGTTAAATGSSGSSGSSGTGTSASDSGGAAEGGATSATAASSACNAATLALEYLGGQGATGHGELGFSLTNTSSADCHTYGYPGVQFLSSSGADLPTDSTRTTQDFFGSLPEHVVTLAPGQTASFRIGVTHIAQGSDSTAGCVTAAKLQVIAPDDTHTLVVALPDGGAYECGTATVSPVQLGNAAYSG